MIFTLDHGIVVITFYENNDKRDMNQLDVDNSLKTGVGIVTQAE